jgi:nucleoside-specific outer membrane channel protein Tsx
VAASNCLRLNNKNKRKHQMVFTPSSLSFCDARPPAANRAPNLSSVRCCGALETWPRSQYSPRPPESGLKKSPDLIPDQKANLPRHWTVARHSKISRNRLFSNSRTGVFWLFESLGSALANSNKADRMDEFSKLQRKAPHQSADLRKKTWNHLLFGSNRMKRTCTSLMLAGSLLAGGQAMAGDLLQWQNNSLTYLYGKDFKVNPHIQQTVTFEHADAWKYGDNFLFIDKIFYNGDKDFNNGPNTYYGEFQPRISLGKVLDQKIEFGPIKDVLLAMTYEFGEGDSESYLIGPGFDLAIPGFDYFQLNFYQRHPDGDRPGNNVWQITPVWSYTIPVGDSNILIDGYMDWVVDNDKNARGEYHANLHFNPQVKYDLGKALNFGEKQLYVGVEYDYWKNKYGIDDTRAFTTNQNVTSFLVKFHF